jgi:hypothetical protein
MNEERNAGRGRLQWHPAFLQAVRQELFNYRDSLEFKYEYQLTSEPLRIDLLIIKKTKNVIIDKNIARIFKTDNLLEYKSPEDHLSVKDFLKVYAYANLYAAITPGADLSEITLSFVASRYPRKLLRYLSGIRGYRVTETSARIYLVSGDYVPIQIIISKKLSERENLWLKSLTGGLEGRGMSAILEAGRKRSPSESIDAYLDVILRANPKTLLEVNNMKAATFEEVFTEAGIIPEWIERGRKQGIEQGREEGMVVAARNALAEGASVEFVRKITGLDMEAIKSLGTGR